MLNYIKILLIKKYKEIILGLNIFNFYNNNSKNTDIEKKK